jgi:hypothetical protein
MTINRTTLLDFPLPVTGTESGVWGDVTNNGLTQYLDISIAGRNALTSANFAGGALTIATTEGDSSATNIAATSAQYATLYVSSLAQNSTITAPASNRAYRVVNADSTYTLTVKAAGQTGVTFPIGTSGTVVFNGTDYVILGTFGSATALKLNGSSSGTATLAAPATASTFTYTLPGQTATLGYLNIPQSGSDKTTSYTLATSDVGEFIGVGTSGSITIPDATFAAGDAISIFNNTTGAITITCTITTAYIAGTDADKATVSLATRGVATILFISGTVCVITGNVS